MQVAPSAERGPVLELVAAAVRPEDQVVVLNVGPATDRGRALEAVSRKHVRARMLGIDHHSPSLPKAHAQEAQQADRLRTKPQAILLEAAFKRTPEIVCVDIEAQAQRDPTEIAGAGEADLVLVGIEISHNR